MDVSQKPSIRTLGELKASGYRPRSVREELRERLVRKLRSGEKLFPGIIGFDQTVIPDLQRAILARHNILLLGLRGQAKTRIARQLVDLLDEYVPVVAGSELNDDPMCPLSRYARDLIAAKGDQTPIEWIHRSERYVEKLATPDVSVADLIGDVDPIKAATLKLPYSDERVLHFGLIPRAHRSIFVINELPDLQARIQVALFNILQEGDIQIRGFKLRLPLDVAFVFTANPEDYTNRGSIITPLKDRIESQILTHYPRTVEEAMAITQQEARLLPQQLDHIHIPEAARILLEQIAFEARASEYVDEKSGVSARLSISAMEHLVSSAELRLLKHAQKRTAVRLSDFMAIIPAITGKIELVYEGEQEGPVAIALHLMDKAMKKLFLRYFPNPDQQRDSDQDFYGVIRQWFGAGNVLELPTDLSDEQYLQALSSVAGLERAARAAGVAESDKVFFMELVLHGLAEFEVVSKDVLEGRVSFRDLLAGMFDEDGDDEH